MIANAEICEFMNTKAVSRLSPGVMARRSVIDEPTLSEG